MKVIIATDSMLMRDHTTLIIEQLLPLFKDIKIVTLAHHPDKILGRIATVPVESTFLSKICKSQADLIKKAWLIPSAAKNITIPENTDLVISISNGYGHGFNVPKNVKHLIYLVHFKDWEKQFATQLSKFLALNTNVWRKKKLSEGKLLLSSGSLLAKETPKIIFPFMKLDDFFYNPETIPSDFYLVNLNQLDEKVLNALSILSKTQKINLKYFGSTKPSHILDSDFIQESCDGVLAFHLNESKGLIDLTMSEFPQKALCALAQGKSVITWGSSFNREFLPEGLVFFIENFSDLETNWKKIDQSISTLSRPLLRRHALKFNARVFKTQIVAELKQLLNS